jgi:hypothetical protein
MEKEKWHIYDGNNQTLRWCDRTAEFDSYESAERFLRSFVEGQNMIFRDYCKITGIYYKKNLLILDPNDTIPINLTHKVVKFKGHSNDCVLVTVKDE